ncbi:MAG: alpha/beta hydrolase family protein [Pyrinomonadaceae bacterium]
MKRIIILSFVLATLHTFAQAQSVRVTIDNNGWKLIGDLQKPQDVKAAPAVLLLHKADGSRDEYKELAGLLAAKGIASLRIDLRGHGESINKGDFGPPYDEKMRAILAGTDSDISAGITYLKAQDGIDPKRIGVLGASYSGEFMAIAGGKNGYQRAYVELSPGSFSEESIKNIDPSGAVWLFVRSVDEPHLKGLHEDIRKISKTAQLYEVPGKEHASRLLPAIPGLTEMIAVWFKHNL